MLLPRPVPGAPVLLPVVVIPGIVSPIVVAGMSPISTLLIEFRELTHVVHIASHIHGRTSGAVVIRTALVPVHWNTEGHTGIQALHSSSSRRRRAPLIVILIARREL